MVSKTPPLLKMGWTMLSVLLVFFTQVVALAQPFTPAVDDNLWETNGTVNTVVRTGNTIYLGGLFDYVGPSTGCGVSLSTQMEHLGMMDAPAYKIDGDVNASVPDGAGGWYVAGKFKHVGGISRINLVHILPDNTVDPVWNPVALETERVNTITLSGNTVYIGGFFTMINGQVRNRLAALDATSGQLTAWDPNANGTVNTLLVNGNTIYVGGAFTNTGGQVRNRIAALDATTGLASDWNPNCDWQVHALALNGGSLYVGGEFSNIGGQARSCFAALNTATGLATAWNPGSNGPIHAVAVADDIVYIGGLFGRAGGQNRNNVAALDATTGLATAWNPNANGAVFSLAVGTTHV
jgi:hypothetical protein